jgi:uncharacterized membrane protein YraQ (UPF0718 family)
MKASFIKSLKAMGKMIPLFLAVVLFMGLVLTYISEETMGEIFTGDPLRDTPVGAIIGSVAAGNPITSYIVGGELLRKSLSLYAVTAFMVAWVTVGVVQYPAESTILGRRFAIQRNILSFILSILVSIATVTTLEAL